MPRYSIKKSEQAEKLAIYQSAFANAVRSLRHNKRLSQEEFAERSGLHRTYISDIERGVRNIAFSNIVRIADALDVSLAKLMQLVERHVSDST